MVDMLQTGSAWLEAQRHLHLSHPVLYARGGQVVELKATVGQTPFEVDVEHGVETRESRDYLIRAQDLVLEGQQTTPARGDRINETVDGAVLSFEVMAPGEEPPWRYADPGHLTLRVHTKAVEAGIN